MITLSAIKPQVIFKLLLTAVFAFSLTGCGYNEIQQKDEQVNAAWSEVVNQYQRRADLVPNLVSTVKGYATHEEKVLTEVTEARANVGKVQLTAAQLEDPQAIQRFQQAQGELSSALSRLLMVKESYPELKADKLFQDLLVQLEGTENRITVARGRYVAAVQGYNVLIRQFPTLVTAKLFGYQAKANFSVENEAAISTAPQVSFQ